MRPEDIRALLRRRHFVPFRMHLSKGRAFEVRHPDQVIVMRSCLVYGGGGDAFPDRLERIALVHVVQVEELASDAAS